MSPRAACRLAALGFEQVYDYMPSKVDWLARGLLLSIATWVLLRYGLLASITTFTTYYAINNSPITLDTAQWFARAGFFIVILFAALLATTWRLARPAAEIGEVCLIKLPWKLPKKKVLFLRIGPPTSKPYWFSLRSGRCCPV